MQHTDIIVIGAGILGAATAWQLSQQYPSKKIVLFEKEQGVAKHQTGRNSGVIHAGVYYPPGSLKAKFCRQGLEETLAFCQQQALPFEQCGKLLVATNELELERMVALYQRCEENQLSPILLSKQQLKQREPNIVGEGAIFVSKTAITHYQGITQRFVDLFKSAGGTAMFGQQVVSLEESETGVLVSTPTQKIFCRTLVNCTGLYTDRITKMLDTRIDYQIVPFKGEYYQLPKKYNDIVKHLIYPIPDPNLPFLGVHLTKMIDGSVTVGPNAVLALAREGYEKWQVNLRDNIELLRFSGTIPLFRKHFRSGINEFKNSFYKKGYLALVQKYCPSLELEDLKPYPAGIRAQAVDKIGNLIHDFKFFETTHSLHIGNAPSPAATSAIPIAKNIVTRLSSKLG